MTVFNIKIPDTVLVFQIIEGADLNENQWRMALTLASDLTFKSMKGAFKRAFGSENIEKDCNFDNLILTHKLNRRMFVIPNNLPDKRKENLILWQNRKLYLVVQFATQKCIR